MSKIVLCFIFLFVTRVDLVEVKLETDGNSGIKHAVILNSRTRLTYGNFIVHKFHRLQVSIGSSSKVRSFNVCAMNCLNSPPCSSFNVASAPGDSNGNLRCDLLHEDQYRRPEQLVPSQAYHHYSIKTPCSSFPCKNSAKCIPEYNSNQYQCVCTPRYTGSHCEIDINECSSNPCSNGGTCIDQVNGYICSCRSGFSGHRCQISQHIVCERNSGQMSCQNRGRINVILANYGRLEGHTCPFGLLTPTNCGMGNSLTRVRGVCQNKVDCQLTASNNFFGGDPCSGTYKYLLVRYQCD